MALMQVKVMFFCYDFEARFVGLQHLSNAVPFKFWESIVHRIVVSNVGCQYRTLFFNQTSGVNILQILGVNRLPFFCVNFWVPIKNLILESNFGC